MQRRCDHVHFASSCNRLLVWRPANTRSLLACQFLLATKQHKRFGHIGQVAIRLELAGLGTSRAIWIDPRCNADLGGSSVKSMRASLLEALRRTEGRCAIRTGRHRSAEAARSPPKVRLRMLSCSWGSGGVAERVVALTFWSDLARCWHGAAVRACGVWRPCR